MYCDESEDLFWREYFSLDMDYDAMRQTLAERDSKLYKCIEYGGGIRLLKQELWETVISFIISANNNIPRIKKIIEELCIQFGDEIDVEGRVFYTFPKPERLANLKREDLSPLKAGYRDRYILDAAKKFESGEVCEEVVSALSTDDARRLLMQIKGVGRKVADCILLFSLGRYDVFPRDVWINRVMEHVYGVTGKDCEEFASKTYGELAGLAQQYLFYYYRYNFKEE